MLHSGGRRRRHPLSGAASPTDLLLIGVAAGHADDLAALYDDLGARVYGIVFAVIGDSSRAADATRQVMTEVWRHAHRWEPSSGSAESWVMTLTHRCVVDLARRDAAVGIDIADDHAVAGRTGCAVGDALARLDEEQRVPIELAYYGGLTQAQIATRLGVSGGDVTTRVRTGLLALRHALQAPEPTGADDPHQR